MSSMNEEKQNKDIVLENNGKYYTCECGSILLKSSKSKHEKTKNIMHQRLILIILY